MNKRPNLFLRGTSELSKEELFSWFTKPTDR